MAALESKLGQHPRWCFTFSGKRIQQSSTAWGLAKQRAGIEDFRFHDLKHPWASWHAQSGTSLPELMELGGWKSYEMAVRGTGPKRSKKRYVRRYGRALMLGKFLINWCARRDSNSRPPGS
jgi:integrase